MDENHQNLFNKVRISSLDQRRPGNYSQEASKQANQEAKSSMSFEMKSMNSRDEMGSDCDSDSKPASGLNPRKKKHKKLLAQQFLAKTKYIEDELNKTPEN